MSKTVHRTCGNCKWQGGSITDKHCGKCKNHSEWDEDWSISKTNSPWWPQEGIDMTSGCAVCKHILCSILDEPCKSCYCDSNFEQEQQYMGQLTRLTTPFWKEVRQWKTNQIGLNINT